MKKLLIVLGLVMSSCSSNYYSQSQDVLFRSWRCTEDIDSTFKINLYLDQMRNGVRGTFDETIEFDGNAPKLLVIDATIFIDKASASSSSGRIVIHNPGFPDTKNFVLSYGVLKVPDAVKENGDVISGITCYSM